LVTVDFGLFYRYSNNFDLVGYSDSDWAGDMIDKKSTTGFVFYMRDITLIWSSKKQSIITLSTCEAEYVAITTCVCHSKKPIEIFVDNLSVIALAKNPVFHERSKHIDIRFHYLRDSITNKEVEVKYVRTQDQVVDIFIKPLKHDVFAKMRDILKVIKKSSLKGNV